MNPIESEIQTIQEQFQLGNISREEHDYLLTEIRDIKLAHECAGNEILFRHLVQVCNVAMKLV